MVERKPELTREEWLAKRVQCETEAPAKSSNVVERNPEPTREEWLATRPQREAEARRRDAERKAEADRTQRLNDELGQSFEAESLDPLLRRRTKLKTAILDQIKCENEPVLRSKMYRSFSNGRHKDVFSQAVEELLKSGDIIETERRDGTRGRIGEAYALAPR